MELPPKHTDHEKGIHVLCTFCCNWQVSTNEITTETYCGTCHCDHTKLAVPWCCAEYSNQRKFKSVMKAFKEDMDSVYEELNKHDKHPGAGVPIDQKNTFKISAKIP